MNWWKNLVETQPVRVAAFVSSLVAIVVTVVTPDMPVEPAIMFVLASMGLGEYAQRKEDKKTDYALNTPAPVEITDVIEN